MIITSHTTVFAYLPNTEGLAAGWDLVKVLESLWWIWEDLCADEAIILESLKMSQKYQLMYKQKGFSDKTGYNIDH